MEREFPRCYEYKWFIRGSFGNRMVPDEPAECSHPISNVSSTLLTFPFNNGCKHFEEKVSTLNRIGEEG
jgi:hypothetical protein